MPIAFGQPAWIDEVLDLLEARVAAVTGLARDKVVSYAGDAAELARDPPGEQFVALWPTSTPVVQPYLDGGGAAHTDFDAQVRLDVYVRVGADRERQAARLLRDRSFGFAGVVRKVARAVQQYTGSADGETSKFVQPTRLLGVQWNDRLTPAGWAWARVTAGVKFRTDLTLVPAPADPPAAP